MSDKSQIEWTDATWNPTRGCELVSPGCARCYAMKTAHRFSGKGLPYEGLTKMGNTGPVWTGEVRTVPEKLDEPLRWREPRRVFVNSMSDLFHEDVPNEYIAAVFGVMAACPQHTFQVLTKRAERLPEWFAWAASGAQEHVARYMQTVPECNLPETSPTNPPPPTPELRRLYDVANAILAPNMPKRRRGIVPEHHWQQWPLPNVWLGVSVEDQKRADERIPHLLRVPAAVRFLSCEPLLEAVDVGGFARTLGAGFAHKWVIGGAESGAGARPSEIRWFRTLRDQCKGAGIPFFFKQAGSRVIWDGWSPPGGHWPSGTEHHDTGLGHFLVKLKSKKGGYMEEWPADLRVREFPRSTP